MITPFRDGETMDYLLLMTVCMYLASAAAYIVYLFIQKDYLQKTGYALVMLGFFLHTAAVFVNYFKTGHMPVQNLHETLSFSAWAVAGVYIAFQFKYRLKILGAYAVPLITFIMLIAYPLPRQPAEAVAALKSFWLIFHVITVFAGEASFALAFGVGLLYLVQENAIKGKHRGFFFKRLPSLELIDTTGYACIVVGFTLLTIGLVTGFMYAHSVWGRFWGWDPKEVWSGISWLLYAALLHGRLALGWRGRKAAIMSILGFAVLLFTFFGVNFLLKGHHGAFTKI